MSLYMSACEKRRGTTAISRVEKKDAPRVPKLLEDGFGLIPSVVAALRF
jgi:hypothetical protein